MDGDTTQGTEKAPQLLSFKEWLEAIEGWRATVGTSEFRKWRVQFKEASENTVSTFNAWLDKPEIWNGTDRPKIGTPNYELAKKSLEYIRNISGTMQEPWRSSFCQWAMESPDLTAILKPMAVEGSAAPDYHLLRADMFKACGEAMCVRNEAGEATRYSKMFKDEKLNNAYLTKNKDGDWVPISEDEVAKLARDPNGPRLLVTGTHAFYENLGDLNPIPDMYEEIARKTAPGINFTTTDQNPGKNDTVTICAVHTRENNFLNLEDLFRRLSDVSKLREHPEQKDDFKHTSQLAVQMNALVLKAVAADDAQMARIDKLPCKDGELQTNGHGYLMYDADANNPLHLHEDAAEIVRKINFCGFSKMGNALYDGSRFLEQQLEAQDEQGNSLVRAAKGSTDDILENLCLTGGSFNETGRNSKSKHAKVQNRSDEIAVEDETPYSEENELHFYDSGEDQKTFGHTFGHKLKGVLGNSTIFDKFATLFAPHAGKAAIAHIEYQAENSTTKNTSLLLTTGQTTNHDLFLKQKVHLEKALKSKGLSHIQIVDNGSANCKQFELRGIDSRDPKQLGQLLKAFEALRDDPDSGIYVSKNITEIEIPVLRTHAAQKGWAGDFIREERPDPKDTKQKLPAIPLDIDTPDRTGATTTHELQAIATGKDQDTEVKWTSAVVGEKSGHKRINPTGGNSGELGA